MESRIILASSSPRRIELLKACGIEPIIIPPSGVSEDLSLPLSMEQAVMYLALKKGLYSEKIYLSQYESDDSALTPAVLIAADTIVFKNGMIGKPLDRADAAATLKRLRNSSHYVATGVSLIKPGTNKRSVFFDVTEVFFKDYSDEEIDQYLDTQEPWDKAGSYAIQGYWGKHISHFAGSYDNVIGFPWGLIQSILKESWPEISLKNETISPTD
ncbi:septum formation protein Maf [Anoxybacterium hadale]|uniref:Septum formation protein Maf n=1 Tax=Anoxybacterium hadale TaxID=3408580 RepID=A0ACD1AAA5_9FIRM|nr:septum formation protein Maf [Clostridiales bacterium]